MTPDTEEETCALAAQITDVRGSVHEFAKSPEHPYFDELVGAMAVYLRAGDDLETAYRKAVAGNAVVRFKMRLRRLFAA